MTHAAFDEVGHRPWPPPSAPWLWRQTWHDLVFLHWRVPASMLRPLIPLPLAIDECERSAWVAVTPFRISGATLRGVPAMPALSAFPELNVRTYVRYNEKPGVWFFSLDAGSRLAVLGGRALFRLPYVYAEMRVTSAQPVSYVSRRPDGQGFRGSYAPTGPVRRSLPGTLEHFLTERYCLYTASSAGNVYRADIHHVPWPLQPADCAIAENGMLRANGIAVNGAPLAHFAQRLDVVIWPLERA